MMNSARCITAVSIATALAWASPTVMARDYANVAEAFEVLSSSETSSRWDAVQYLAQHPEESVPRLMEMLRNQENGWIYGNSALIRSVDHEEDKGKDYGKDEDQMDAALSLP